MKIIELNELQLNNDEKALVEEHRFRNAVSRKSIGKREAYEVVIDRLKNFLCEECINHYLLILQNSVETDITEGQYAAIIADRKSREEKYPNILSSYRPHGYKFEDSIQIKYRACMDAIINLNNIDTDASFGEYIIRLFEWILKMEVLEKMTGLIREKRLLLTQRKFMYKLAIECLTEIRKRLFVY